MRQLLVLPLVLGLALPVYARTAPSLDETAMHTLARTLVAEASFHTEDYAPIAWVLHKRWVVYCRNNEPVPFARFVRMYSALWKPEHTRRKRTIRKLPWGAAIGEFGGKRWDRARQWVERWNEGGVGDPCPSAMQWGGTMDRPAGHWAPVSCGRTQNIFYTVSGSRSQT